MTRSQPLAIGLVLLAVLFVVLAVLYQLGSIQLLTRTGSGAHTTHAVVLGALALLALVGANFARPQNA